MYPSKRTSVCGEKLPNAWGLHDVHGNVYEWCWDLDYGGGSNRVNRGGSWLSPAANCRTALRIMSQPTSRTGDDGFRLALSSPSGVQSPEAEHGKGAEP